MFLIKRDLPPEQHVCFTPETSFNTPLVPGDVWLCDCGQYHIWKPSDTSTGWVKISDRRAKKQYKRFTSGRPFKQACGHDRGPG